METVQPIREKVQITQMQSILKSQSQRNYILFNLGIYSGLRISDILKLKVKDIRNQTHFILRETKTGKAKRLKIQPTFKIEMDQYIKGKPDSEYLFKSKKSTNSIDRVQAYRILSDAAKQLGIPEIGTHSLRKTFGYHFYNQYNDATGRGLTMLQEIFNHSTPHVTLRYIGITQDSVDLMIDDFDYAL